MPEVPFRGMSKFSCALEPESSYLEEYKTFLDLADGVARSNSSSIPEAFRRRRGVSSRRGRCNAWDLTQTGAVQALLNGRAISDLFLDQGIDAFKRIRPREDVVVYSTQYSRTLESALAFWAGFAANHPPFEDSPSSSQLPNFTIHQQVSFCFDRCDCPRSKKLLEAQKRTMSKFLREHPAVKDLASTLSRIMYPGDEGVSSSVVYFTVLVSLDCSSPLFFKQNWFYLLHFDTKNSFNRSGSISVSVNSEAPEFLCLNSQPESRKSFIFTWHGSSLKWFYHKEDNHLLIFCVFSRECSSISQKYKLGIVWEYFKDQGKGPFGSISPIDAYMANGFFLYSLEYSQKFPG